MVAFIVCMALVSGIFLGASALANWWALEGPAIALDWLSFFFYLLAVCLMAGNAQSGLQFTLALAMAVVAGVWLSDRAEHPGERLPNVEG
jgi:hypothetical protein